MVKIVKLIKYKKDNFKADKLAKQIKKIQNKKTKSQQVGFKTYKKNLKLHESKDTKYAIHKSKSKSNTHKSKSHNSKNHKFKSHKSKSHKSKSKITSSKNIPDLEKINLIKNSKIIQPDELVISDMTPYIKDSNKDAYKLPVQTISSLDNQYIIAIPSYKRSDIIQTHTLAVLNLHKIKAEYITIFVANKAEYIIYKQALPSFLYNNIVIGSLGLKNQRNFISEYYPEGTNIVEMDDDIKSIMQLVVKRQLSKKSKQSKKSKSIKASTSSIKTVKPIEDLDAFIKRAFEMCIESNIFLWGVYPLVNPHFMTYKVTTDLRFIVGPMWGMINRHRQDLKLTVDEKENSERTLQFWVADGSVLRFNNVGIETKYYKNKGGMQEEGKDRKEEALKSVYYLNKMYPKLTQISLTKKNGMPEIKMKRTTL